LIPLLGDPRLDEITNADVQQLKAKLGHLSVKSVNNTLTVLSVVLKKAVEWGVVDTMPCTIKLLKWHSAERPFYDLDDYERMLTAAKKIGGHAELLVLLGGDAGLRVGEIPALKWHNVLFDRRVVRVAEAEWRGVTTLPKSGRTRDVPMTDRVYAALKAQRHMRGAKVFFDDDAEIIQMRTLRTWMEQVERRGGFEVRAAFTSSATRSARISRCSARPRRRSRSSRDTPISRRRCATCTCRRRRVRRRSLCSTRARLLPEPPRSSRAVETSGRRAVPEKKNPAHSPGSVVGATGFEPVTPTV
jgi:integrase